jgi:hypothetical protein
MSAAPPPPMPAMLACQRDPERWFERHHRRDALAGCLACPVRAWCAREALGCHASWGMWAGVWIDGHHDDAAPSLRAIADNDATQPDCPLSAAESAANPPPPPAAPLRRPSAVVPARSVAAALLLRSSGHCEVLAEGCHYSFDRTVSRRPAGESGESVSPAELFATCGHCAQVVAHLQPRLATRAGYVLAPGRDPAAVPFRWRGTRWVLLGRDGWLTEIHDDAQTA